MITFLGRHTLLIVDRNIIVIYNTYCIDKLILNIHFTVFHQVLCREWGNTTLTPPRILTSRGTQNVFYLCLWRLWNHLESDHNQRDRSCRSLRP